MNITSAAQRTPARIHAIVRLVASGAEDCIQVDSLGRVHQPLQGPNGRNATTENLNAAKYLQLVVEDGDRICLHEDVTPDMIHDPVVFREYLRRQMLNIVNPADPNYVFNLFTAWYAFQGADVLRQTPSNIEANFNHHFGTDNSRAINDTKLRGWRLWAHYFGWGYEFNNRFIPDATGRIRPIIGDIFSEAKTDVLNINAFIATLGQRCAELDDGDLFAHVQEQVGSTSGPNLSLMLSVGLRVLEREQVIAFQHTSDASDLRYLAAGTGIDDKPITSIQYLKWGAQ